MKLVRLYPYTPRFGYNLRSLVVTKLGMKFVGERGWYEVSDEAAAFLRTRLQDSTQPHGPKAFMIAESREDAKQLDAAFNATIRDPEEERAGTPDAPIRQAASTESKRPGRRSTVAAPVEISGDDDGDDEAKEPTAGKPRSRRRSTEAAGDDE
jgi:hypothetical protein